MQTVQVLLIEDNAAEAVLLKEALDGNNPLVTFNVEVADRLSEGLNQIAKNAFDLVLLDLGLPDSHGLETLQGVAGKYPAIPVVVLTGREDAELGVHAVGQGAQDYLIKSQINSDSLTRVIRYAIERQRQQQESERIRQGNEREREMRSLAELAVAPASSVTTQALGQQTIREASEGNFSTLCRKYDELLELAIDERTYNVNHNLSDKLRDLALEIGSLKGGPRDVIEVHTRILNDKVVGGPYEKLQVYTEEARLLVLELMGYLVTHYRSQLGPDFKQ